MKRSKVKNSDLDLINIGRGSSESIYTPPNYLIQEDRLNVKGGGMKLLSVSDAIYADPSHFSYINPELCIKDGCPCEEIDQWSPPMKDGKPITIAQAKKIVEGGSMTDDETLAKAFELMKSMSPNSAWKPLLLAVIHIAEKRGAEIGLLASQIPHYAPTRNLDLTPIRYREREEQVMKKMGWVRLGKEEKDAVHDYLEFVKDNTKPNELDDLILTVNDILRRLISEEEA